MRPLPFYFFLFFLCCTSQISKSKSNDIVIKIIISDENEEGITRKDGKLQRPKKEGEFNIVTMDEEDFVVNLEETQVQGEDLQIAEEEELFINEEIIINGPRNQELINEEETTLFSPLSTIIIKPATRIFQVYSDAYTGAYREISVWRADLTADPGYYSLGDVAMSSYVATQTVYVASAERDELRPPVDYVQVWNDVGSEGDQSGSFWQSIPPSGYFCLGNVAQNGYAKPSTDLIRCIQSSLVRPTQNIISVWDDSGSGAHRHIGVWEILPNSDDTLGFGLNLFVSVGYYGYPSGLDLRVLDLRAIKHDSSVTPLPTITIRSASRIFQVYSDKDTEAQKDISVWRADSNADPGYYSLGDVAVSGYVASKTVYVASGEGDELQPPVDYLQIWDDIDLGGDQEGSFWQPIPPSGYYCLGNVVQNGYSKPSTDLIRCVKSSLVRPTQNIFPVWDVDGSSAHQYVGVWEILPNAGDSLGKGLNLFVSVSYYVRPSVLDLRVIDRRALKDT